MHATLVGRERELALLEATLNRTLAGSGGIVLISGEAGIGKTSLVGTICQHATDGQAIVHTGACYDLSVTPPYGPWIEIFSGLDGDISLPPLPVDPAKQPVGWSTSQDALFAEAMDALTAAASSRTRVLVLEDLHWADTASLEFLRYAARRIGDLPLLIIGTYRDTEIDRQHPLHANLPALIREADATRISLTPLDEAHISTLVDQHYHLSVTDRTRLISYLQRRTEGNPFFIGELMRSLEESGVIRQQGTTWTVGDLRRILVPALIRQVIDSRLAKIDAESRHILSVGAAIGQDIDLDIWIDASDAGETRLSDVVAEATRLNVLEDSSIPGTMRFTHALIREALYYDLSLPERRHLHRAIGEAQQRIRGNDPDAIAYHFHQGQDDRAAEWLMIAGERAQQLYAWRTAAERFTTALDLTASDGDLARARGWLCYRIGLLLTYADSASGIDRMQEAEHIAELTGDAQLGAFARADRGLLRCLTGDVRRGLAEMQSGVDHIERLQATDIPADEDGSNHRGHLSTASIRRGTFQLISNAEDINVRQGTLVFWLAWAGRYREALSIGEAFVERSAATHGRFQDAIGDAYAGLGHALAAFGRPDEALAAFSRARDTYAAIDHHFKVGNTAIYELSEAFLPYRADRIMEREWLADQAEAG
jgi:predicted ATPase